MQCRQEQRQSINTNCRVSTGPGLSRRAVLTDLSSEGCSLVSPRLSLRRSETISVQLAERRTVRAEVRWSRRGEAVGLRFCRPLDATEVDDIARAALRNSIDGVAPRRQIVLDRSRIRPVC